MIFSYLASKIGAWGSPAGASGLYSARPARIARLRRRIARRPLLPLEEIQAPPRLSAGPLAALLASGWTIGGRSVDLRSPEIPWTLGDRSDAFNLHAWNPIGYLLMEHSDGGGQEYLDTSLAFARTWMRDFFAGMESLSVAEAAAAVTARADGDLAWQDMAVGTRIYRLAYLLDVLARRGVVHAADAADAADDDFPVFFRALVLHLEVLGREEFFNRRTNHGLYQALGHLAASRRFEFLPGMAAHRRLAEARLAEIARRMFLPSGAHAEHSPGYHFLVLGTFVGARNSGLLSDRDVLDTIAAAEKVLMWMVQPDGSLVPIGDTDLKRGYRGGSNVERFADPRLRYVLSGGRIGEAPADGIIGLDDAGYAFGRAICRDDYARSTYFAQIAGFHSRTHKHADHLSFVWIEQGERILIDPGKYGFIGKTTLGDALSQQGFFYTDPRRIHVEKTRAHNCVEIDGNDYKRRKAGFFGSALLSAADTGGVWTTVAEVLHETVRHVRIVFVKPTHFLLCADWLSDEDGEPHDFRQWFQLAPEWRAEASGAGLLAEHASGAMTLRAASLLPEVGLAGIHHGATEPFMSGWSSDAAKSLVPSPSAEWTVKGAACASFATLFSLSGTLAVAGPRSRVDAGALGGWFGWTDDRGCHALGFDRSGPAGTVEVSFERVARDARPE